MGTFKARIGDNEISIGLNGEGHIATINDMTHSPDITGNSEDGWSVILNDRSYTVEVFKKEDGRVDLLVNGRRYAVEVSDRYDELLKSLGMDRNSGSKVSNVKAPMPGKVLNVAVNSGDAINTGDTLLVLEAMKMENVIKSPVSGVIASVDIDTGANVEKNQVMVTFE